MASKDIYFKPLEIYLPFNKAQFVEFHDQVNIYGVTYVITVIIRVINNPYNSMYPHTKNHKYLEIISF